MQTDSRLGKIIGVQVTVNKPNASLKTTKGWKDINWRKLERQLFKLQKHIYKASERGDKELSN
ncbi:MAG: hypothetical protein F6K10_41015 [Moorea sp. SIO2B7]|nr:hypothetical protein [Moorena sp. SIO2B7]